MQDGEENGVSVVVQQAWGGAGRGGGAGAPPPRAVIDMACKRMFESADYDSHEEEIEDEEGMEELIEEVEDDDDEDKVNRDEAVYAARLASFGVARLTAVAVGTADAAGGGKNERGPPGTRPLFSSGSSSNDARDILIERMPRAGAGDAGGGGAIRAGTSGNGRVGMGPGREQDLQLSPVSQPAHSLTLRNSSSLTPAEDLPNSNLETLSPAERRRVSGGSGGIASPIAADSGVSSATPALPSASKAKTVSGGEIGRKEGRVPDGNVVLAESRAKGSGEGEQERAAMETAATEDISDQQDGSAMSPRPERGTQPAGIDTGDQGTPGLDPRLVFKSEGVGRGVEGEVKDELVAARKVSDRKNGDDGAVPQTDDQVFLSSLASPGDDDIDDTSLSSSPDEGGSIHDSYPTPISRDTPTPAVPHGEGYGEESDQVDVGSVLPSTEIEAREASEEGRSDRDSSADEMYNTKVKTDHYGFFINSERKGLDLPAETLKARRLKEGSRTHKWRKMIDSFDHWRAGRKASRLRSRVRKGVPDCVRGKVWQMVMGSTAMMEKEPKKYAELLASDVPVDGPIEEDIPRTMFDHEMFCKDSRVDGKDMLRRVLTAYGRYDREVQYCQGINYICALFLLYMPEENAFWLLVASMQRPCAPLRELFLPGMVKAQEFQFVVDALTAKYCDKLSTQILANNLTPAMYATQWFLTAFTQRFPYDFVTRVWDIFLLEDWKIFYRVCLALFKSVEDEASKLDLDKMNLLLRELPSRVDAEEILGVAASIPLKHRHIEKRTAIFYNEVSARNG